MSPTTVPDEVWARAIHAVTVEKLSLRQAAQRYGVHHMSLHRRVRGRYPSQPSQTSSAYLTHEQEREAVSVLREQLEHEGQITDEDVRFVVRAIASNSNQRPMPAEFPAAGWIASFRRAHGLVPHIYVKHDVPMDPPMSRPMSTLVQYPTTSAPLPPSASHAKTDSSSNNSNSSAEASKAPAKGYRDSHAVPAEDWEKAIAAVKEQNLSLRAAAKIYGVHFAALHRRLKKREQQGGEPPNHEEYFHPDDEAGIIRVVVARAELGVLMTQGELQNLVQRAALRNLPHLDTTATGKVYSRFCSRNEASIRHIILEWMNVKPPATSVAAASDANLPAVSTLPPLYSRLSSSTWPPTSSPY